MSKRGVSTWNAPSPSKKQNDGYRKQVCPHGSSFPCSQCMGPDVQARVQRIVTDPSSGALMIDGVVARASLIPQTELTSIREELSRKMTRSHEGGRRESTCGVCGGTGHTRKTCGQRSKLISAPPILEDRPRRINRCGSCGETGHNSATCPQRTVFVKEAA